MSALPSGAKAQHNGFEPAPRRTAPAARFGGRSSSDFRESASPASPRKTSTRRPPEPRRSPQCACQRRAIPNKLTRRPGATAPTAPATSSATAARRLSRVSPRGQGASPP